MVSKARIRLSSTDPQDINTICAEIKEIADKTGVKLKGPIHLPKKKKKNPINSQTNAEVEAYRDIRRTGPENEGNGCQSHVNIHEGVHGNVTVVCCQGNVPLARVRGPGRRDPERCRYRIRGRPDL